MYNTLQKLVAEFVGTFTICLAGAGAICADQFLKAGNPGAAGIGLLGIAVATGLAYANMICALGHISGGQFNPAATIGFWVTKKIGTIEAVLYCLMQLSGAATAALLLTIVLPQDVWHAPGVMLGTPMLASGMTSVNGMILEAAMTFLLVWVMFAMASESNVNYRAVAGFAVGLTVCMDMLLGGPFTGAALNPARAFGPALVSRTWRDHGVYWVGPLFGGAVAAAIYTSLMRRKQGES